jgi:hypothetical protein
LLASCAPVARLFLRAFVDHRREGRSPAYWSRSRSSNNNDHEQEVELKRRKANAKDQWLDSATATNTQACDEENPAIRWDGHGHERSESRVSKAEMPEHLDDRCVTVKTDITVQVDDGRSTSSGGARLLPDGSEGLERYH